MTPDEHVENVKSKLDTLHKAQHRAKVAGDELHEALAAFATEHGESLGLHEELRAMAAVPKTPPTNE